MLELETVHSSMKKERKDPGAFDRGIIADVSAILLVPIFWIFVLNFWMRTVLMKGTTVGRELLLVTMMDKLCKVKSTVLSR